MQHVDHASLVHLLHIFALVGVVVLFVRLRPLRWVAAWLRGSRG